MNVIAVLFFAAVSAMAWFLLEVGYDRGFREGYSSGISERRAERPLRERMVPCDTDTDCMLKNGGDGSPSPRVKL